MTPCSSPVREGSGQEGRPDSTTAPEERPQQQERQPEELGEPEHTDSPVNESLTADQAATTATDLEGLSLDIDTFPRGRGPVVDAASDEDTKKDAGQEPPVSYFDDSEEGSQTSSEESWASFPSSGSNTTDSSGAGAGEDDGDDSPVTADDDDGPLPSPETTFEFHEEFGQAGEALKDGYEPSPGEEGLTLGDDDGDNVPCPEEDAGPWSSRAIPKWAFLRSSNSLPVLGLGPEDFHHGGSALRYEVEVDEVEAEEEKEHDSDEDGEDVRRSSRDLEAVGVVYL